MWLNPDPLHERRVCQGIDSDPSSAESETSFALSKLSRTISLSLCTTIPAISCARASRSSKHTAKAEIRAAVEYLLRGATGGARGDIVQEIIAIVRDVANGQRPDPLDDDMPGG
jgi:hypothetical protein